MMKIFGLLALVALQACAASRTLPAPPSEFQRRSFRNVRVVETGPPPRIRLDVAAKGWLAGIPAGACDVARAMFDVGSDPTADQAALIGLFAPVGLIIGAFCGPFAALPTETVERDERTLREVLDKAATGFASRVEGVMGSARRGIPPGGDDVVLSVGLVSIDLTGPFCLDPFERPKVRARVCLMRPADGQVLYEAEVGHSGRPRAFTSWASSPEELGGCFNRALQALAERVVEEVFLVVPPPEEGDPQ